MANIIEYMNIRSMEKALKKARTVIISVDVIE